MTTRLSTKLFALALALVMNGTVLGGVAYLFSGPSAHAAGVALVRTAGAEIPGARLAGATPASVAV
jgi:hypothetical protein